jgi:hypothetical protein
MGERGFIYVRGSVGYINVAGGQKELWEGRTGLPDGRRGRGNRCHGGLSEQHVLEFFPGKMGVTGATVTKGRNNNSS